MGIASLKILSPSRYGNPEGFPHIAPAWIVDALREASRHEPELAPDRLLPYMKWKPVPRARSTGMMYKRLWTNLNHAARHVFIIGDADGLPSTHLLQAARSLTDAYPHQVEIIWTGSNPTTLQVGGVELKYLKKISGEGNQANRIIALGRALLEIQPATITVASSDIGWAVLQAHAAALSEYSGLFAELPAVKNGESDNLGGTAALYISAGPQPAVRLLAALKETIKHWVDNFGIDGDEVLLIAASMNATFDVRAKEIAPVATITLNGKQ